VELYIHYPNTPSWRGTQLKRSTGTTVPLLYLRPHYFKFKTRYIYHTAQPDDLFSGISLSPFHIKKIQRKVLDFSEILKPIMYNVPIFSFFISFLSDEPFF
jgi:hypothetical protein